MNRFLDELSGGMKSCQVFGGRLLVAVSGGADSVALLRGLVELAPTLSLELYVAHFNHHLRGEESDADASWVAELAGALNLPYELGHSVSGDFAADGSGLEENARSLRYHFLDQAAGLFDCQTIVLAHTANDQAETVLHHVLRGTGMSGLRGMKRVRNTPQGKRLVRPLLSIHRGTLEDYLIAIGQSFRSDSSNTDVALTRNRLRHVILPMLRDQLNPQVDLAILRLAEQAADVEVFVSEIVGNQLGRVLRDSQPDTCRLDIEELVHQSRYLVCELFRELWQRQSWPQQAMGFEQWNRLAETLRTRETITLPNRIEARYHSKSLLILRRL